jgi:hypothetical protein
MAAPFLNPRLTAVEDASREPAIVTALPGADLEWLEVTIRKGVFAISVSEPP